MGVLGLRSGVLRKLSIKSELCIYDLFYDYGRNQHAEKEPAGEVNKFQKLFGALVA
jgi:hypothetical protein